jgi:CubicO group peptidase (beta-lactamase class C family)
MNKIIFVLIVISVIGCKPPTSHDINPRYSQEIEDKIKRIMENLQVETQFWNQYKTSTIEERLVHYQTPGISVAVINNGVIEWARGFGVKDIKTNEPVTPNTLFQAASISKALVSLAFMKLKEKHEINLDTDVNVYLKSWKIPSNNGWQPVITLRQLLSHTAGLTVSGFVGYSSGAEIPTTVQILKGEYPANSEPVIANIIPGTRFRYSGGGLVVAQLVLEDKFNKKLDKIMDSLVLNPLNLKYSTYEQPISKSKNNLTATGYEAFYQTVKGNHNIYPEMAAAGLWTNPTELAKIVIEIQKAYKGESGFISAESVNEMLTPQKVEPGMGIGLFLEGSGDTLLFGHSGGNIGFNSQIYGYKKFGKGAVVMINSSGFQVINSNFQLVFEVMRSIAKEYNWPDYFKENKKYNIKEEVLNSFCGQYISEEGWEIKIAKKGHRLTIELLSQPPVYLNAESDNKFYSEQLNMKVEFTKANNNIEKLDIQQDWWKHVVAMKKK